MIENVNILKMASAMARYAAQRHQQLAENIANADTANYRAKDLEPFADAYQKFETNIDKMGSVSAALNKSGSFAQLVDMPGTESPNGNNVSLEDQIMRSVEAQQDHETATVLYRKSIGMLRAALGSGR